jgi:hypothetical protein
MASHHPFLLQDVIDDLVKPEITLVAPLMKLLVLARFIKNERLRTYVEREIEGYMTLPDDLEIPEYRKTPGTIYLDCLSITGATMTMAVPHTLLEEPNLQEHFRYMVFRQGIGTIEQLAKDRGDGEKAEQSVHTPFQLQLLSLFEKGFKKLNPHTPFNIIGGRIEGSAYMLIEIPNTVRSRLMNFTLELVEEFGIQIDISSFNQCREQNNQIIYNIMSKTEITNTGDGNVVNTGDYATQNASISINKGDWNSLQKALQHQGVDDADIDELKTIVEIEKPENAKLGNKTVNWILKVAGKALQGIGKIATGVSSNLLATLIKNYHGFQD